MLLATTADLPPQVSLLHFTLMDIASIPAMNYRVIRFGVEYTPRGLPEIVILFLSCKLEVAKVRSTCESLSTVVE